MSTIYLIIAENKNMRLAYQVKKKKKLDATKM